MHLESTPRPALAAHMLSSRTLRLVLLLGLLPACGGGGGAPTPAPAPSQTLAGVVRSALNGSAISGVEVSALGGTALATTDDLGVFVLIGPMPLGTLAVSFDASAVGAGGYQPLTVDVVLDGGHDNFPRAVILHDHTFAPKLSVATDAAGAAGGGIALALGDDFAIAGADGTLIFLDGVPATSQTVELGLNTVKAIEIPVALPTAAVGQSFCSIAPWNAGFDVDGAGKGLDIELKNPGILALGTLLDIYWFNPSSSVWINRSAITGIQGTVVDHGGVTRIDAPGIATGGGIYTAALPVCPTCTWTLDASVEFFDGTPIAGATVALSTGQFAQTAADGSFTLTGVTGYDAQASQATPPVGSPVSVAWSVVMPAVWGGGWTNGLISAGIVTPGGTVQQILGVAAAPVGLLAGRVEGSAPPGGSPTLVELKALIGQVPTQSVAPQADGSFFFSGLPAGGYQVSYPFPSADAVLGLPIQVAEVTTVTLKEGLPLDAVDVLVLLDTDGDLTTPATPQAGARVTVQGANGTGGERTTDANGVARFFGLDEPLTVTAQFDWDSGGAGGGSLLRLASTLTGLEAQASVVSVPLIHEPQTPFVLKNALIQGTLSNVTLGPTESVGIVVFAHGLPAGASAVSKLVAVQGNSYSVNVPSGVSLTVAAVKSGLDGLAFVQTRELMFAPDLAPIASQGSLTLDFDFGGSGVVAVDQAVNVSFAGQLTGSPFTEVALVLGGLNGLDGRLPIALYDPSATTGVLLVPDFGDAGLAGLGLGLGAGGEGATQDYYCTLEFSTTPTAVAFPLDVPATFTNPTAGMSATTDQFEQLTVSVTGAAGGTPAGWAGVNLISIEGSADLGGGVDAMSWTLWLRETDESIALPPTSWPMFAGGNTAIFGIDRFRFDSGQAFDYETFFDSDLAAKLVGLSTTLTDECESNAEIGVTVTTPAP